MQPDRFVANLWNPCARRLVENKLGHGTAILMCGNVLESAIGPLGCVAEVEASPVLVLAP